MIRLKENESLPQDLQNKRRDKIVLNDYFMEPQTSAAANSISENQSNSKLNQNNMLFLNNHPNINTFSFKLISNINIKHKGIIFPMPPSGKSFKYLFF